MRYMWIPHTDTVVVVTCDPFDESLPCARISITSPQRTLARFSSISSSQQRSTPPDTHPPPPLPPACLHALDRSPPAITQEKDLANAQPLRELLIECSYKHGKAVSKADANKMNFAQLRDGLLALAPLDRAHVIAVNTGKAAQQHKQHTQSSTATIPSHRCPLYHPQLKPSTGRNRKGTAWTGRTSYSGSTAAGSSGCRRWLCPAAPSLRPTAKICST